MPTFRKKLDEFLVLSYNFFVVSPIVFDDTYVEEMFVVLVIHVFDSFFLSVYYLLEVFLFKGVKVDRVFFVAVLNIHFLFNVFFHNRPVVINENGRRELVDFFEATLVDGRNQICQRHRFTSSRRSVQQNSGRKRRHVTVGRLLTVLFFVLIRFDIYHRQYKVLRNTVIINSIDGNLTGVVRTGGGKRQSPQEANSFFYNFLSPFSLQMTSCRAFSNDITRVTPHCAHQFVYA